MPAEVVNCPKCGISISSKQECPFCSEKNREDNGDGKEEDDREVDKNGGHSSQAVN
jgi:hypothetical protein